MAHLKNTDKILKMARSFELFALGQKAPPVFKRPIDENKAIDIYEQYLKPILNAINFFSNLERKAKEASKPSKKLDAAYIAAGGSPSEVIAGRVSFPSSVLESKKLPHWQLLIGPQRMNLANEKINGDMIEGMLILSEDAYIWEKKFTKEVVNLKGRVDAALNAYKTTK